MGVLHPHGHRPYPLVEEEHASIFGHPVAEHEPALAQGRRVGDLDAEELRSLVALDDDRVLARYRSLFGAEDQG